VIDRRADVPSAWPKGWAEDYASRETYRRAVKEYAEVLAREGWERFPIIRCISPHNLHHTPFWIWNACDDGIAAALGIETRSAATTGAVGEADESPTPQGERP
jgi:hypothetical protein